MNSIEDITNMIATEAHELAFVCPDCKALSSQEHEFWCSTYLDNRIKIMSELAEDEGAESEVELCQRALDGHKQSQEECARVLKESDKNGF
jgi:hypothetical protein